MSGDAPVIIIKKKKGGHHDGHHGGAWKVAYADFVTAMMAFFLLLWLLNVTTDEQRGGIAEYFNPAAVAYQASGAGGVLGGTSVATPGPMSSPSSPASVFRSQPGRPEPAADSDTMDDGSTDEVVDADQLGDRERPVDAKVFNANRPPSEEELEFLKNSRDLPQDEMEFLLRTSDFDEEQMAFLRQSRGVSDGELAEALAEQEQRRFVEAGAELRQAIEDLPELRELAQNMMIDVTPEGLRIQIVDQEGRSMFPTGSARMLDRTGQLIDLVAKAIDDLPNKVSIKGHTDSTPFIGTGDYGNWELSSDRANASRRALLDAGLSPNRITDVVGKADTDHLFVDDPDSPRNRRISIILLREAPPS
ncbi:MAG: OmpA family protein [Inquilinus sp.]|nr:OmpA family protein [Inquilinus sp.]